MLLHVEFPQLFFFESAPFYLINVLSFEKLWKTSAPRRAFEFQPEKIYNILILSQPSMKALSTFVQTQKSLLARTQADIERLRQLKDDALSQPSLVISNLGHEVGLMPFSLGRKN